MTNGPDRTGVLRLRWRPRSCAAAGRRLRRTRARRRPSTFDLALDFYVNPDHAGIYDGLDAGYFADAGLDVRPRVPSDPSAPIKQVAAGQVDLAISYEPEVMLARDQGLDVVAVAALVHGPLTSLISLPDAGIEEPADLEGKTVVTAGIPYQTAYLETILRDAGVEPRRRRSGRRRLQPAASRCSPAAPTRCSAASSTSRACSWPSAGSIRGSCPVDELGIPTYDELVLVADGERVREDPEAIRAFLAALERGDGERGRRPRCGDRRAPRGRARARAGADPGRGRADDSAPRVRPKASRSATWTRPSGSGSPTSSPTRTRSTAAPAVEELLTNDLLP